MSDNKKYTLKSIVIKEAMEGNEYTGDFSGLEKAGYKITKISMNWVSGKCPNGFDFEAKIFAEDSDYGILGGRVSKLGIKPSATNWGHSEVKYDRGWDVLARENAAGLVVHFLKALDQNVTKQQVWDDYKKHETEQMEEAKKCKIEEAKKVALQKKVGKVMKETDEKMLDEVGIHNTKEAMSHYTQEKFDAPLKEYVNKFTPKGLANFIKDVYMGDYIKSSKFDLFIATLCRAMK